jgi:hypothetical protein
MSKFSKPLGDKSILNPNFKYVPSSKTNIRDTFRRAKKELNFTTSNQENNKPLVPQGGNNLDKPLVLNPGGFVLGIEWLEN